MKKYLKVIESLKATRTIPADNKLYHGTNIISAAEILLDNTLKGTTLAKINNKDLKGCSFSRSINFASNYKYEKFDEDQSLWVVFECNTRKLKQHNKIVPYNYWNDMFGDKDTLGIWSDYGNQEEEFVIGDISNFKSYINNIFIDNTIKTTDNDKLIEYLVVEGNFDKQDATNIITMLKM